MLLLLGISEQPAEVQVVLALQRVETQGVEPQVLALQRVETQGAEPQVLALRRVETQGAEPQVLALRRVETQGAEGRVRARDNQARQRTLELHRLTRTES
jgi:hypothetical protein